MVNEHYWSIAKQVANWAGGLNSRIIYCQLHHETGGFTSELCTQFHNLAGVTQTEPNDLGQPDGQYFYKQFDTDEDFAQWFGKYLRLYMEDGLFDATDIQTYAEAIKRGGYYGDTVENYVAGMKAAYMGAWG